MTKPRMIAFDFETSGELPEYALQPWRVRQGKAHVTSLVWMYYNSDGKRVTHKLLKPTVADMRNMLRFAISEGRALVGWNTVFDVSWLLAYGLEHDVMRASFLDGMLLWKHATIEPEYKLAAGKRKSYGLKAGVKELFPNEAGYEEDIDFHDVSDESMQKLLDYNVKDVRFTMKLTNYWYHKLTPTQMRAARLEAAAIPLVAQANLAGMRVDVAAAQKLVDDLTVTAAQRLEALAPYGVSEEVVRSPTKLKKLMFEDWGLKSVKTNEKTKTDSTDKEALHELSLSDDRAKQLREYREALNNRTKFAATPLASVTYNEDGCTHPQAILFGTYSGRLTYSSSQGRGKGKRQTGFALHQEKRGAEYRSILVPPEGYTLLEFDASGQEFRWMAIAADDATMLRLCAPGEDAHSYMGAAIARVDYQQLLADLHNGDKVAKSRRQLGKVANLSLQYRTSAKRLRSVARVQYGLDMSEEEAKSIRDTYIETYSNVPEYWKQQIKLVAARKYVETFAGRRVIVDGDWDESGWSMGSTAINYRIQGTGADQKYLALATLKPWMLEHGVRFAWDLHDGIYLYVPDAFVDTAARQIKDMLDNLDYQRMWGFTPPIPLPWDAKVGKSWGDLKEYKYD